MDKNRLIQQIDNLKNDIQNLINKKKILNDKNEIKLVNEEKKVKISNLKKLTDELKKILKQEKIEFLKEKIVSKFGEKSNCNAVNFKR
jgi:hypothetical protein